MSAINTLSEATDILREAKTRAPESDHGKIDAQLAVINADRVDRVDRSSGITPPDGGSNGLTIAGNIVAAEKRAGRA